MTSLAYDEAVAKCRRAYRIKGARWPVPLIAFLDDPPSEPRVFDWLTRCVGDLLDQLGQSDVELCGALDLARRSAVEGASLGLVEQSAWHLWSRRATRGAPGTAVAQLLFALLAHRERRQFSRGSCATPLVLLDQLASNEGGLLERVVANFTDYVKGQRIARSIEGAADC